MSNVDKITLEQFRQMCVRHDLTFDYSDDSGCYRAGLASLKEIDSAIETIGLPKETDRIWNEVVDEKIIESSAPQFYRGDYKYIADDKLKQYQEGENK
jgi:hypothetical protein